MAPINMSTIKNVSINASTITQSLQDFSLQNFILSIKPLLFFIVGMTIYAVFIFKFYKFLARRDIIQLKTNKYYDAYEGFLNKLARSVFYVFENLIIIPILIFFWFGVLAVLLAFLSKNQASINILLTSASIVAAVRITAYYNENLSQDLAKMIPFALLGIFLVDISFFKLDDAIAQLKDLPTMFHYLLYYLMFVTLLEFILRIVHGISTLIIKKDIIQEASEE